MANSLDVEVYMNILESIDEYIQNIKKNPYVYATHKLGIEVFSIYIKQELLMVECVDMCDLKIDRLFAYWIPKHKKYLSEEQAYQMVYAIHDIYKYLLKSAHPSKTTDFPAILDLFGQEYMRIYKVRNILLKMTKDPILAVDPLVIDLNFYRNKNKKKKSHSMEMATTYEQGIFKVSECKEGGQVFLTKLNQNKTYKLLLDYPTYKYFKKGDLIHAVIKKKLFYVYWELEELKSYYLPQAEAYL